MNTQLKLERAKSLHKIRQDKVRGGIIAGTHTSRTSSSKPNIQNLPQRSLSKLFQTRPSRADKVLCDGSEFCDHPACIHYKPHKPESYARGRGVYYCTDIADPVGTRRTCPFVDIDGYIVCKYIVCKAVGWPKKTLSVHKMYRNICRVKHNLQKMVKP